ncbi:MAG: methionine gamma-lyase family protein [Clostridia bacterium]|nr:methionine gamma-lyase family protein [Clostridia bacterium]
MAFETFNEKIMKIAEEAEEALKEVFAGFDGTAFACTTRVVDAFRENRVSTSHFMPADGYGYGDCGRDTLDKIYARVLGAEAAFVRHNIINGTQALAIGLFGLLRPGDLLLSVTGDPYDTLQGVVSGQDGYGSLKEWGVLYEKREIGENFSEFMKDARLKVVYIQRSRGYTSREALSVNEICEIYRYVKSRRPDVYVMVDNCYGAFVEPREPECDLMVGSLIKTIGGGMASCGGYLAGSSEAVELAANRWSCPGIGLEAGASLYENKNIYKGVFYAPHTVAQALKTAALAAYIFEKQGFEVSPKYNDPRHDIIQTVTLHDPDKLCAFCRGIQKGSPVDSFVTPEPWDMPGYEDKVIMAAGAFVQGASIELSCDGPMREPYTAYMQGGLTYESGKYAILSALKEIITAEG